MTLGGATWWRDGVLYQIYPRSFADGNGDGVGDLPGIIGRLDHLEWLGVDGIWLNPITVSPDKDMGYDVADYCTVQPALGTLSDVDRLIAEAGRRGIRVILDLVPNHTSDQHPWFIDSRSSRASRHRDWYVWADARPDGSPPNNWLSAFGGPAWSFDRRTNQYYLHQFDPGQPDLNWWNEEVRDAFDAIIRFWLDRGVAGFRIDVADGIVKDRQLRDNPPATRDDHPQVRRFGQRRLYNANLPEIHEIFRRWRALTDRFDPPRVLIGETAVYDLTHLAAYYGQTDELHLAFNFAFLHSRFQAAELLQIVEQTEAALTASSWPVWTLSNHDVSRVASRWCGEDPDRVRCALMLLLTLRGTPVLYYGDEIGMIDTAIAREDVHDPIGKRYWPQRRGRDPARTPMLWAPEPGAGFTRPGVRPWLPLGDPRIRNVADQRRDPASSLTLVRDLIGLRRKRADLRDGEYQSMPAPDGVWRYRRGKTTTVAVNLSAGPARVEDISGVVLVHTRRKGDGERVSGHLALGPWEGVVCSSDPT